MGRKKWTTRLATEDCPALNIDALTRHGLFRAAPWTDFTCEWKYGGAGAFSKISLRISRDDEGRHILWLSYGFPGLPLQSIPPTVYQISLTQTNCHFGGIRHWFICPVVKNRIPCNRRVGRLYLPLGSRYFGCRTCYNLTFRSRQQHDKSLDPFMRLSVIELLTAMRSPEIGRAHV